MKSHMAVYLLPILSKWVFLLGHDYFNSCEILCHKSKNVKTISEKVMKITISTNDLAQIFCNTRTTVSMKTASFSLQLPAQVARGRSYRLPLLRPRPPLPAGKPSTQHVTVLWAWRRLLHASFGKQYRLSQFNKTVDRVAACFRLPVVPWSGVEFPEVLSKPHPSSGPLPRCSDVLPAGPRVSIYTPTAAVSPAGKLLPRPSSPQRLPGAPQKPPSTANTTHSQVQPGILAWVLSP